MDRLKKPELLAPAGNWDSLVAAIEAGCDALYLSGTLYGARSYAGNFTKEELVKAIDYAHLYGVKVYVTTNIVIYEAEVKNFMKYIDFLCKNRVDAIIVQDLGMMDLIRQKYPNLEIHASTQMHIHNVEAVQLMEQLHINRVVLARETSISLVKEIKEKTNMPIEIFCHGALCISYSGQCLMSSLIGGRSGNRGTCAQSCRQRYTLESDNKKIKNGYLLSTKDLNTLNYIPELIEAGIDSLKIEGRMKRPEYVYLVVSIYRMFIDEYISNQKIPDIKPYLYELEKIFNRKFTKGFLFSEDNNKLINSYRPNHIGTPLGQVLGYHHNQVKIKLIDSLNINDGIRFLIDDGDDIGFIVTKMYKNNKSVKQAKKADIIEIPYKNNISNKVKVVKTTDYEQIEMIKRDINSHKRKISIDVYLEGFIGKPVKLTICDLDNKEIVMYSDYIIKSSINSSISEDSIKKHINHLGNTPYQINSFNIKIDSNIFIPVKVLNDIRRAAINKLTEDRLKVNSNVLISTYNLTLPNYPIEQNKTILIHSIDDYNKIKDKAFSDIYIDDIDTFKQINDNHKVLKLDRVIEHHLPYYNEKILIGELGSIKLSNNVITDFSFNVTNSYTVAFLHSLGVKKITLSYEMNDYQIKKLIDNYHFRYQKHPNLELIVDSIPEVMVSKYKLVTNNGYNNWLIDRFNNKYKINIHNNLMYIKHYKRLKRDNPNHYFEMGINNIRYEL